MIWRELKIAFVVFGFFALLGVLAVFAYRGGSFLTSGFIPLLAAIVVITASTLALEVYRRRIDNTVRRRSQTPANDSEALATAPLQILSERELEPRRVEEVWALYGSSFRDAVQQQHQKITQQFAQTLIANISQVIEISALTFTRYLFKAAAPPSPSEHLDFTPRDRSVAEATLKNALAIQRGSSDPITWSQALWQSVSEESKRPRRSRSN